MPNIQKYRGIRGLVALEVTTDIPQKALSVIYRLQ